MLRQVWLTAYLLFLEPIQFTGDGYARYTLLDSGTEMSFYEETVSMCIQTDAKEGLLFRMSGHNDFAVLKVSL